MTLDAPHWPDAIFDDLDRTGPTPMYSQVASRLEHAIRTGEIPPGGRLESEIAIGERLNLSRPTVRRALQDLVDKGLLVRRRGLGTQVVRGEVTRQVELTSLFEDLEAAQMNPQTTVLLREVVPASRKVADALGLSEGDDVLYIRRLRSANGTPMAVMQNYLPERFGSITIESLASRGLYQMLRAKGVAIRIAQQKIGARGATADEGTLLGIERGAPLLTMERVAYDNAGHVFEFGTHCYRPDMYSFETSVVAR